MEETTPHEMLQLAMLEARKRELFLAGYNAEYVEVIADLEMNISATDLTAEERAAYCEQYNRLIEKAK